MRISEYLEQKNRTNVAFATELGVPPSLLSQWANDVRPVPAERCLAIERASGGLIRCEELRPDIDWTRVPDLAEGSEGQRIPDAAQVSQAAAA